VKKCIHCFEVKSLDEFIKDKRRPDGRGSICKPCRRVECARDYRKRKASIRASNVDYIERMAVEKRQLMVDWYRANPCSDCGETDIRVLQADHIDPTQKKYNIAFLLSRGFGVAALVEELEKCRSLCANCHMRHTAEQFGFWRSKLGVAAP
jgi:hypothetical protein